MIFVHGVDYMSTMLGIRGAFFFLGSRLNGIATDRGLCYLSFHEARVNLW